MSIGARKRQALLAISLSFVLTLLQVTSSIIKPDIAQAAGFTNFQLTYDNHDDRNLVSENKYLAWTKDSGNGNQNVFFTDLLTSRFIQLTSDQSPKKDLSIDPDTSIITWAAGIGDQTDIYAYSPKTGASARLTQNEKSNQKPKTTDGVFVWQGRDDSGYFQIYKSESFGAGVDSVALTSGTTNHTNPFISKVGGITYVIWQDPSGSLSYWNKADGQINTATTPAPGCSDRINDITAGTTAFVERCRVSLTLITSTVKVFSVGSDVSPADDTITQMSAAGQTASSAPSISSGRIAWVEGTLYNSEIWGCSVANCDGTRIQATNNNYTDDSPQIGRGGNFLVWHSLQGQSDDIMAYRIPTATTYTITNDSTYDESPRISDSGWGGWIRQDTDGDTEIFTVVPTADTPVGSNVEVQVGPFTKITFDTVSLAGETMVIPRSLFSVAPDTPPTGIKLGDHPTFYEITTTASWSGTAIVCLEYYPGNFNIPESSMSVYHAEGGVWVDRTISVDTLNHQACAGVTSFSEVAFAERQPTAINSVTPTKVDWKTETAVEITVNGTGFYENTSLRLGDITLTDVQFIDRSTLKGTFTFSAGTKVKKGTTYTLYLDSPSQPTLSLPAAVTFDKIKK